MRKYFLLLLLLLSGCIFVDESPNRCYHLWDPSQKDNCLLMVATQTENISKCGEINKTDIAEQCYSTLLGSGNAQNASICNRMSGIRRDDCLSQLATAKNDTSFCMTINYSYERDNCISNIAVARARPDLCEPISVSLSRDTCKNQIYGQLAINNKDTSFCNMLISENSSNENMVDRCIFGMARKLNDTSYCNQITNFLTKELCITGEIDTASCDQITDPMGKEACIYISAAYSNDSSKCATLSSAAFKDNCYIQVAKNTNDPRVCSFISSSDLRSQCAQIVQQP
jgi:hypothetical protein